MDLAGKGSFTKSLGSFKVEERWSTTVMLKKRRFWDELEVYDMLNDDSPLTISRRFNTKPQQEEGVVHRSKKKYSG
eukprot:scaffold2335_cov175-Amphora_coffeaeformis.AAC.12